MPRISEGGVSDVNVDPDYVAPPGMAPADAIEAGIPSVGERDEQPTPDDVARPTAPKPTPARKTK
jgi:hypothetical protein